MIMEFILASNIRLTNHTITQPLIERLSEEREGFPAIFCHLLSQIIARPYVRQH